VTYWQKTNVLFGSLEHKRGLWGGKIEENGKSVLFFLE